MLSTAWTRRELPRRPVVVCGAGAAGVAAAVAAARCGADVLLVEAATQVGGTVANALIHTLGGLFDSRGNWINDGLPRELGERLQEADPRSGPRKMGRVWVWQTCPNIYRRTLDAWLKQETRITTVVGAKIDSATQLRGQVTELEFAVGQERLVVRPQSVVDATGTAAVARLLGQSHVIDDIDRAAGGLIFRLGNIAAGGLAFPKGVGLVKGLRLAAEAGALPLSCRHVWIDTGLEKDEAFVKLVVRHGGEGSYQEALNAQGAIVTYLRNVPEFREAVVMQTGSLGVRDGGRIAGRYMLTADDVRGGRSFADAVCRCAWPIEYWDSDRGVTIEYLPDQSAYEIPMRCLQLVGIDNYWAAGKCVSADRYAHASARVAGTCWAMGQAVGAAAALGPPAGKEEALEREPLRAIS